MAARIPLQELFELPARGPNESPAGGCLFDSERLRYRDGGFCVIALAHAVDHPRERQVIDDLRALKPLAGFQRPLRLGLDVSDSRHGRLNFLVTNIDRARIFSLTLDVVTPGITLARQLRNLLLKLVVHRLEPQRDQRLDHRHATLKAHVALHLFD